MKKVLFTTMSIIAVAAMMLVSCKKDNGTDDNKGKDDGKDPVEQYTGPVEGTENWAIIGTILGANWDKDYKAASAAENIFVVKNVKLEAGNEFKWRDTSSGNGGWDVNRGGDFVALGEAFDVEANGHNIKPELDGIYDIYLNLAVDQAAIVAKDGAQPTWKELPKALAWDYVMNISDWHVNSEFHWKNAGLPVNLKAFTIEWKFYATEWNNYDKDMERNGETYHVWCNRLGQISDESETGFLFRFNDGGQKGSLRFGSKPFGNFDVYVGGNSRNAYIWSLNEWHVLSIVADGTNVTFYDNGEQIYQKAQATTAVYDEYAITRFDISMTWDEGTTNYPRGQAFQGYQAYTRLWNKALTVDEIKANLCGIDPTATPEELMIYWAYNNDEGTTVVNHGTAEGKDLDFTKALGAGQGDFVSATAIAASWTDVTEVEGLAPVCPAPAATE